MIRLILLGMLVAPLFSCKGLEQPFPNKKLYTIDAGPATAPSGSAAEQKDALRVRAVDLASPFDSLAFTYKVGPSQFETDYYNNFITSPTRLLRGELVRRLSGSGLYSTVTDVGSIVSTPLSLEMNVTALYGDYTNRPAAAAVIEARVFLIRSDASSDQIVFQKSYSVSEPCSDDSPDALVAAWGKAYGRIIDELIADLQTASR